MSDPTHASVALNAQARIESAALLTHFDALVDPRQPGKVIYPLNEVLLPVFTGDVGRSRDLRIALFGIKKREWLRRLMSLGCRNVTTGRLAGAFTRLP